MCCEIGAVHVPRRSRRYISFMRLLSLRIISLISLSIFVASSNLPQHCPMSYSGGLCGAELLAASGRALQVSLDIQTVKCRLRGQQGTDRLAQSVSQCYCKRIWAKCSAAQWWWDCFRAEMFSSTRLYLYHAFLPQPSYKASTYHLNLIYYLPRSDSCLDTPVIPLS